MEQVVAVVSGVESFKGSFIEELMLAMKGGNTIISGAELTDEMVVVGEMNAFERALYSVMDNCEAAEKELLPRLMQVVMEGDKDARHVLDAEVHKTRERFKAARTLMWENVRTRLVGVLPCFGEDGIDLCIVGDGQITFKPSDNKPEVSMEIIEIGMPMGFFGARRGGGGISDLLEALGAGRSGEGSRRFGFGGSRSR